MTATRIICLFNLKPGATVAAYEAWARSRDLPTVNKLPSVDRFEIFKATGVLGSPAAPPYQYIEVIDVNDMNRFGSDVANATMQQIATEFMGWADATFITTSALNGENA